MRKTKTKSKEKSESNPTTSETPHKGVGLFDHVKAIRQYQDPDYFKSLTPLDLKSFNHFMILKAISMNPALLSDVGFLFKYFEIIPAPQFYTLLIGLVPANKTYYPWIKSQKKIKKRLMELVSEKFECSNSEAIEYIHLLSKQENGEKLLYNICRGYGLTDREIEKVMNGTDKEEDT